MKKLAIGTHGLLVFAWLGLAAPHGLTAVERQTAQKPAAPAGKPAATADALDQLLAPIALYPDQLLAQMLPSASNPGKMAALGEWLASQTLKGTELQDAATKAGSSRASWPWSSFPQVVNAMAGIWPGRPGSARRSQPIARPSSPVSSGWGQGARGREAQEHAATGGRDPDHVERPAGDRDRAGQPAGRLRSAVNPQTVYTTSHGGRSAGESSANAVAAGLIGFTAGIAIGAAMDNDYYYGPYGWRGGGYMYDDAWDDCWTTREDAREDWQDHREDLVDERGDRASNAQEQRTERQQSGQQQRTEAQQRGRRIRRRRRSATRSARKRRRQPGRAGRRARARRPAGTAASEDQATRERSGTKSDAFSGYSSGKSERAASQRGQSSRSSSRSRGGRR